MAATADVNRTTRPAEQQAPEVVNAATIYRGAWAGLVGITDSTTANRGRATLFTSAKNRIWLDGFAQAQAVGDTSATPPVPVRLNNGRLEYRLAVTGLAGTVNGDMGTGIVWQTDSNTWTLTRAALAYPFGKIVEVISSTETWVRRITDADLAQFSLNRVVQHLGNVHLSGSTHTKAGIPVPFHCQVESVKAWLVGAALSGTSSPIAVTININNGTSAIAITGGAISVTTAKALGAFLTATAVTATNIAHEGETFEIVVTPASQVSSTGEIEVHLVLQARLGT